MRRLPYALTSLLALTSVVMFAACSDDFPIEDPADAPATQESAISRDQLLEWESEWMLADAMLDLYGINIRELSHAELTEALEREVTKAAADPGHPHPRHAVSDDFCQRLHTDLVAQQRPADAVKWCQAMKELD